MSALRWIYLAAGTFLVMGLLLQSLPLAAPISIQAANATAQELDAEAPSSEIQFGQEFLFAAQNDLQELPPQEEQPLPVIVQEQPPRLVGIARQNGELVIWLQSNADPAIALHVGDEISAWRVVSISETSARISSEQEELELRLFGGHQ